MTAMYTPGDVLRTDSPLAALGELDRSSIDPFVSPGLEEGYFRRRSVRSDTGERWTPLRRDRRRGWRCCLGRIAYVRRSG